MSGGEKANHGVLSMNPSLKYRIVKIVLGGVTLLVAVTTILAYAGRAEPYLSPPPLFAGQLSPIVVIVAVALGSYLIVRRLRSRYWKAAGRGANLTPEDSGLFGATEFAGTVGGRPVSVQVHQETSGSSGAGGGRRNYTVVSAELSERADEGVIISPVDGDGPAVQPFEVEDEADIADDKLAAIGGSETATEAVITGRARDALLAVEDLNQVFVGNESVTFDTLERDGTINGADLDIRWSVVNKYDDDYDHWGKKTGDASTVSHISRNLVLDPDELRKQVEAAVAVAHAFEGAV